MSWSSHSQNLPRDFHDLFLGAQKRDRWLHHGIDGLKHAVAINAFHQSDETISSIFDDHIGRKKLRHTECIDMVVLHCSPRADNYSRGKSNTYDNLRPRNFCETDSFVYGRSQPARFLFGNLRASAPQGAQKLTHTSFLVRGAS